MDQLSRLEALRASIIDSQGIDFCALYCSVTGTVVGCLYLDMFIPLADSTSDDEQLGDELIMACLAYSRPAPVLAIIRESTWDTIRESNPTLLLSYLLGRLYDDSALNNEERCGFMYRIDSIRKRIRLASSLGSLTPSARDTLLLILLEFDSRSNLNKLLAPMGIDIFLESLSDEPALLEAFTAWHHKTRTALDIEAQRLTAESRYNRTLGKAFVSQFFDPSSLAMNGYVAKRASGESREVGQKRAAKAKAVSASVATALALFDQLEDDIESFEPVKRPAPAPQKVFVGKFNFSRLGRKDS